MINSQLIKKILLFFLIIFTLETAIASEVIPIFENFNSTQPSNWITDGNATWGVTHGTKETLELTQNLDNQAGLGFFDQSFSSEKGIISEFSYYSNERTSEDGADGIAFFLVDGDKVNSSNIKPGQSGGPLGYGYEQSGTTEGIPHAYLGVGFDEFGNFVVEGGDTNLGTDSPDSVGIRGKGNQQTGYDYLTHTSVSNDFGETIDGGWRTARVTVIPGVDNATIIVEMSFDDGKTWDTIIDEYTYNQTPPENLKLGFSGSTGGSDNIHAIGNLNVQLPIDLETTILSQPEDKHKRGDSFNYSFSITNNGPNNANNITINNTINTNLFSDINWSYVTTQNQTGNGNKDNLSIINLPLDKDEIVNVSISGVFKNQFWGIAEHSIIATPEEGKLDQSPTTAQKNMPLDVVKYPPEININESINTYVNTGSAVQVAPNLSILYADNLFIDGATVSIDLGFEKGDILSVSSTPNITTSYDSNNGILTLDGNATKDAYESLFQTIKFSNSNSNPTPKPRTISFSFGSNIFYSQQTGFYYEFVNAPGITWHEAKDAANNRTLQGKQGYLATIRSQEENDIIIDKVQGAGWIGASDENEESIWRWVTGPERLENNGEGVHFFTQTGSNTGNAYDGNKPGGGNPINNEYNNWDYNEPNNWESGENKGHFCFNSGACPNGKWNDYDNSNPNIDGYVVKYGGMPNDINTTSTATHNVSVVKDKAPIPVITASANTTGINTTIQFNANSSQDDFGITNFEWNFGDGNSSTGEVVEHNYTSDGNYTVKLTLTDTGNLVSSTQIGISVIDGFVLIANPGSNYSVDQGNSITLDGSLSNASNNISSYFWELGNGITSNDIQVSHIFEEAGIHKVNLTITDNQSNSVRASTNVSVNDITKPFANFSVNASEIKQGESVEFDATSSNDNVGIESYEWDIDGNNRINTNGSIITQQFNESRTINVTLYVRDTSGNVNSSSYEINILDSEPPIVNAGPNRTVKIGERISFNGINSTDNIAIDSFNWDFNDTTTSNEIVVEHFYENIGVYNVSLMLNDTLNNTNSTTVMINVTNRSVSPANLVKTEIKNTQGSQIQLTLTTDEALNELNVSIDGKEFSIANANEVEKTFNTFEYIITHNPNSQGNYSVSIVDLTDNFSNVASINKNFSIVVNNPLSSGGGGGSSQNKVNDDDDDDDENESEENDEEQKSDSTSSPENNLNENVSNNEKSLSIQTKNENNSTTIEINNNESIDDFYVILENENGDTYNISGDSFIKTENEDGSYTYKTSEGNIISGEYKATLFSNDGRTFESDPLDINVTTIENNDADNEKIITTTTNNNSCKIFGINLGSLLFCWYWWGILIVLSIISLIGYRKYYHK